MRVLAAVCSAVLVAAVSGCSNVTEEPPVTATPVETTTTVAETTTSLAETTTSVAETTTTSTAPVIEVGDGYVKESDLVYMSLDGTEYLMDVYTPDGEGPWPMAVVFHGLDSDGKNGPDQTVIAKRAAAGGILVFVPSWLGSFSGLDLESWLKWKQTTGCAVVFAQEQAALRGGDPARTVLHGFSAGVGGPLWAAHDPIDGPIQGCMADGTALPPRGLVLGDGHYTLFSPEWDQVFADDPAEMRDELAGLLDPARWPADLSERVFLWTAVNGSPPPRTIESGWMDQRDPDGSIRSDLEGLGLLDDGEVSTGDEGQLLALRMREAGLDVVIDEFPGGHIVLGKSEELVGYIQAALSD